MLWVMGSNINLGLFGVKGLKGHFHQKYDYCYRIHAIISLRNIVSMLAHTYALAWDLYCIHAVKVNLGSILPAGYTGYADNAM